MVAAIAISAFFIIAGIVGLLLSKRLTTGRLLSIAGSLSLLFFQFLIILLPFTRLIAVRVAELTILSIPCLFFIFVPHIMRLLSRR